MKKILPFIVMVVLGFYSKSQNTIGLPQIINYDKNNFKAGTQTWDIEQDAQGRMYFANNEGLITFDGTFWKTHALPNKTIMRSLAIDKTGKIYVGGQGEIGFYMTDNSGFLRYTSLIPLLPSSQTTFADIWDIEISGESIFFRATDRIFELRNKTISVFPPVSEWQFLKQVGGKMLAQDKEKGLFLFQKGSWIPASNNTLLENSIISGIVEEGKDKYLISTLNNRFLILKHDSLFTNNKFKKTTINSTLYKTIQMNEGAFAVGTTAEGCLILNHEGNVIQKISRKEGLQNNNVLSVFLDKDKNLWTGLNNGISFIAYNSAVKYISPNKENEVSGFSSRVFNNKLYIGTSDGAYIVNLSAENRDLSFSKGNFSLIKNSSGEVWKLDEINQQLLMGHNNGCYKIQGDIAMPISRDAGWLFVPTVSVSPSKHILTGTYTGLKMLEQKEGGIVDVGNLKGIYESLRFLAIDNENRIWASHPYRGIYLITLSNDQKSYTAKLLTAKDGLPSSLSNHVFKIKNRVVFATTNGVYEYQSDKKIFTPSTFLTPILGNIEIRYMNDDDDGNIWFCSGKKLGVIKFSKDDNQQATITYFPEVTGQILSGFENIYPYNKENIFIASEKGVIHLNYEKYKSNALKLGIILGSVRAIGKIDSTIFGGYFENAKNLETNNTTQKNTTLASNYNSFHFEYSSPAFGLQNNVEYSYNLDGYDKQWSGWTSKTEKDYTNLPSGKYTFQVKAHDNLGNESTTTLYTFSVNPPWYKTVIAYVIYLVLLFLILYSVNNWQKRKLHFQTIKFEEKQKQINTLHQLELEKNEKEIIKLKNEKLEGEILLKTKELADTSMHLVERSDALLKVKEELQKLYKNTNENHDIKKTLTLLNDIEKNDSNWEKFAVHFDEVNNNFLKNLKLRFPKLTNNDLKVCAYLQLNLASKEISQLMNIGVRGVEISRYRLRKKLGLSTEQSLIDFLNESA